MSVTLVGLMENLQWSPTTTLVVEIQHIKNRCYENDFISVFLNIYFVGAITA